MLTSFPNGELICTRNSNRYKWYLKSNQASTYLPKKQRSLAEQLVHRSISGHFVRSKSEVFIDMALYSNKIPFRYECALTLGTTTIYPDFTIRHPKTGETYYWEHFGLMDDPSYCKNSCSKLQLYTTHGIIPSIHLITTYETHDHPLSTEVIDSILHTYFL